MKSRWIIVILALAGILIYLLIPREDKPAPRLPQEPSSPVVTTQKLPAPADREMVSESGIPDIKAPGRAQPAEITASGVAVLPGSRERLLQINSPEESPLHDIEIIEETIASFRQIFGQNPTGGTNAEITAALTGSNTKELAIVPPEFAAINSEGEIIDRWGTPYFFHPVSSQVMEVLSAGPDQLLWTGDDVGSITPANQEAQLE